MASPMTRYSVIQVGNEQTDNFPFAVVNHHGFEIDRYTDKSVACEIASRLNNGGASLLDEVWEQMPALIYVIDKQGAMRMTTAQEFSS